MAIYKAIYAKHGSLRKNEVISPEGEIIFQADNESHAVRRLEDYFTINNYNRFLKIFELKDISNYWCIHKTIYKK